MGDPLSMGASEQPKARKKLGGKIAAILAILVIVGGLGFGGWFYNDFSSTIANQKKTIDDLRKQLGALGTRSGGGGTGAATVSCDGGSVYSANVGKFRLTLSSPNVIVRNIDAGFEGGPITDLTIGQCVSGQRNVVDDYPTRKVSILAHPSMSSADLRSSFESRWGSALTAGSTVNVAGVSARIYTGEGLFNTKLLFFDHAGIGYQIELTDSNESSEAVLTDVISDWAYTP